MVVMPRARADRTASVPGGRRALSRRAVVGALVVPLVVGAAGELALIAAGVRGVAQQAGFYAGSLLAVLVLARVWARDGRAHAGFVALPAAAIVAIIVVAGLRLVPWLVVQPPGPLAVGGPGAVGGSAAADGTAAFGAPLAAILLIGLTALSEEAYFRGLLLGRLLPAGATRAVVWVTVVFAALHAVSQPLLLPAIAADGVLFAVLRLRWGSLAPAVLVHAAVNLTAAFLPPPADVPLVTLAIYQVCVVCADAGLAAAVWRWHRDEAPS